MLGNSLPSPNQTERLQLVRDVREGARFRFVKERVDVDGLVLLKNWEAQVFKILKEG